MLRVFHFEIHAENPQRAADFYSQVFGWAAHKKMVEGEDYTLLHTGRLDEGGINGGIKKRIHPKASSVPAIEVPSVDEFVKRVTAAGGTVLLPRTAVKKTGFIVYCQDTEGNVFSILEKNNSVG